MMLNSLKRKIKRKLGLPTLPSEYTSRLRSEFRNIRHGGHAIQKLLDNYSFESVLDIGSGDGQQAEIFQQHSKKVTAIDFGKSIQYEQRNQNYSVITGDFLNIDLPNHFDCTWASHVLEHVPNAGNFLRKIQQSTREGGVICITVPPLKHQIVGGHVNLWNTGLLIYNLILSNLNCQNAIALAYGYNISVILKKETISLPELSSGPGDLDKLKRFFPKEINWNQSLGKSFGRQSNFNGLIEEINWW